MTGQGLLFDGAGVEKGARFSESRVHRYALWRIWEKDKPMVMFIGLNPSTADENVDDNTIRRCIGFARDWGYGGLYMLNLFGFRATLPSDLKKAEDKVGPDNDQALEEYAYQSKEIIVAWGVDGTLDGQDQDVCESPLHYCKLMCLGKTKQGHPRHPLYLRKDSKRIVFRDRPHQ